MTLSSFYSKTDVRKKRSIGSEESGSTLPTAQSSHAAMQRLACASRHLNVGFYRRCLAYLRSQRIHTSRPSILQDSSGNTCTLIDCIIHVSERTKCPFNSKST